MSALTVTLSRQLVLEVPVQAPDGAGGYARNWQALGTLWAEVTALSGRERDGGDVSMATARFRITVRGASVASSKRPAPGQRFRDGPRVFTIQSVSERDALGRYLQCLAVEEVVT
ncbi:Phage head-tail joining protein [Shimia sp. SK013]|uniref:head-tail adaptor protein n=1 Tax=Shimia sp. SK013 TaxID=1389006 RepID=UPI0006B531EF|nr:head-tail adaptor protein [Shimia sp. SK013]KPA22816.1 Phage head-tail joining protein [Shimia sp. SK013]